MSSQILRFSNFIRSKKKKNKDLEKLSTSHHRLQSHRNCNHLKEVDGINHNLHRARAVLEGTGGYFRLHRSMSWQITFLHDPVVHHPTLNQWHHHAFLLPSHPLCFPIYSSMTDSKGFDDRSSSSMKDCSFGIARIYIKRKIIVIDRIRTMEVKLE